MYRTESGSKHINIYCGRGRLPRGRKARVRPDQSGLKHAWGRGWYIPTCRGISPAVENIVSI